MMFQAVETGVVSPEDNAKHKGSEDPKQQNKSSHGNEVKYFTRCNTTISIFILLTSRRSVYIRKKITAILSNSSST